MVVEMLEKSAEKQIKTENAKYGGEGGWRWPSIGLIIRY